MNIIERWMNRIGGVAGALFVGSLVVNKMLFTVDGGQRALIFDRFSGIKPDIKGEGLHFIIPGIQWPIYMDIRTTPKLIGSKTGTKDLQMVNIDLRVLYRPDLDFLPGIYLNLG
jgi:prohibitin 1